MQKDWLLLIINAKQQYNSLAEGNGSSQISKIQVYNRIKEISNNHKWISHPE